MAGRKLFYLFQSKYFVNFSAGSFLLNSDFFPFVRKQSKGETDKSLTFSPDFACF